MFTPDSIHALILSAQDCPTIASFIAKYGSVIRTASFPDGTAKLLFQILYESRDDGIDPLAIRALSGLSRAEYSRRYSIPVRTVENWECDGANAHKCPEYVSLLLLSDVLNRISREE